MEVMGIGILLTGPSGVGNSELALELLSRGHRLVADDAPEFRRTAPDAVHGSCPPMLADFIEVRGLGILNVRAMYGNNAVMPHKRLHLIIHLQHLTENGNVSEFDRLDSKQRHRSILGVDIPEVILPVAAGRDLAVIIEAAVRNHVLYLNGYNAAEDFIERQQQYIDNKDA
jgi:HPr kinase/phosphorylase